MIGRLWRDWRRERVLRRAPIPERLWTQALSHFIFARNLPVADAERLRRWSTLFLHSKTFSAAGGHELTQAMRLDVAVQACILILNLDVDAYDGWTEVIVYPEEFYPEHTWQDESGVVHTERGPMAGEAWLHGPVVLSWEDVAHSSEPDGVNVVIHEFAHKLDMLNGDANGFPPLHKEMSRGEWSGAFAAAYADFSKRVAMRQPVEIDPYAAESPAEFFAVMSEAFFEIPGAVYSTYPRVYEQLRLFYRQHPLERIQSAHGLFGGRE